MAILHIFVFCFFSLCGIALALLPFWKVSERLRTAHADFWRDFGPFDYKTLLKQGEPYKNFLNVITLTDIYQDMFKNDAPLLFWARMSREFIRLIPRSPMGKIITVLAYFFLMGYFTADLL